MTKFPSRIVVATLTALSLSVGVPALASASPPHSSNSNSSSQTYRQELRAYREANAEIQATFQAAVHTARSTYQQALLTATTSTERNAALQTMKTAIIQAAAQRSAALVALGNPPSR